MTIKTCSIFSKPSGTTHFPVQYANMSNSEESSSEQQNSNQPLEEGEIKEKRPRKQHAPVELGVDGEGRALFKGPLEGIYFVKVTKNGKERKIYLKELNPRRSSSEGGTKRKAEDELDEGEQPKRKRVRKSKAAPPNSGDDEVFELGLDENPEE